MTEHQVFNLTSLGSIASDDSLYLESCGLLPVSGEQQSSPYTIQSITSEVNDDTLIAQFLNHENQARTDLSLVNQAKIGTPLT